MTHYATVPRPICLHNEATKIAKSLTEGAGTGSGGTGGKSMHYHIAYEEALSVLQEDLLVAQERALECAKMRLKSNAARVNGVSI